MTRQGQLVTSGVFDQQRHEVSNRAGETRVRHVHGSLDDLRTQVREMFLQPRLDFGQGLHLISLVHGSRMMWFPGPGNRLTNDRDE